jgi:hypothetical protein
MSLWNKSLELWRAAAAHEVSDQAHHGEDDEDVDRRRSDVEHRESEDPSDGEEDCEDEQHDPSSLHAARHAVTHPVVIGPAEMKRVAILVFAAACGSSSPAPVAPTAGAGSAAIAQPTAACAPPAQPGLLGITDITVKDNGKDMMAIKANGDVQINDTGWKTIGTLDPSGKFVTADHQTGQLGADGTFSTPEGPAPFKLDGAALVANGQRITIENGKLVGGNDTAKTVEIVCANDDSTKRTALLILGLLLSAQPTPAPAATSIPPAPTK